MESFIWGALMLFALVLFIYIYKNTAGRDKAEDAAKPAVEDLPITEQEDSGEHIDAAESEAEPKRSKKGNVVPAIALVAVCAVVIGCSLGFGGSVKETAPSLEPSVEIEVTPHPSEQIKEYICQNLPSDVMDMLTNRDDISVNVSDDGVSVKLRLLLAMDFPYVAEKAAPVVSTAAHNAGLEVSMLELQKYLQEKDGSMDTDTLVDWRIDDLHFMSGFFMAVPDDNFVKGDCTVSFLYDYYKVEN